MVAYGVFSTGSISSYCTVDQVKALLVGYDLARIGDSEAVDDRISDLLGLTRQAIDTLAGHDFFWHADESVVVDGPGTDRLCLAPLGLVPLATVQEITSAGQVVPAADYVVYSPTGEIRLRPEASIGSCFARGLQNIQLLVDWGYSDVPAEATMAQAKLTAAQILCEAAGETSGTTALRVGDYAIQYARAGKYGAVIEQLAREAAQTMRPYRGLGMAAI